MEGVELEVGAEDAGQRVDVFLARRVEGMSRARAKVLFKRGQVRIDGRLATKGQRLEAGALVSLERTPSPGDFEAAPDPDTSLRIVSETSNYVVVDKPIGMPCHPLREGELGTVAGALVARFPEMRGVGYRRREPGIVHRLDNDTSGLLLAARNVETFRSLHAQLRAGAIEKRYVARCLGTVEAPAVIDIPIASDPHDRRKVRACRDPGEARRLRARPASTEILSSIRETTGSAVEVRANRARRHQIRVHLAAIGHPLLGDILYGAPPHDPPHHHLRATKLRFELDGRRIEIGL